MYISPQPVDLQVILKVSPSGSSYNYFSTVCLNINFNLPWNKKKKNSIYTLLNRKQKSIPYFRTERVVLFVLLLLFDRRIPFFFACTFVLNVEVTENLL